MNFVYIMIYILILFNLDICWNLMAKDDLTKTDGKRMIYRQPMGIDGKG